MRPAAALLPALCALAGTSLWAAGIALESPELAVEHGGSRLLSCRIPDPGASGEPDPDAGPWESSGRPENGSERRFRLLCFPSCSGSPENIPGNIPENIPENITADLIIYPAPEQPPVLWVQDGTGMCPELPLAPERNLSVTLSCGNGTFLSPESTSCGIARIAGNAILALYAFPSAPSLDSPRHLEASARSSASCSVRAAFPAPRLSLALSGIPLPAAASADGTRVTAELPPRRPGTHELRCVGRVGPRERRVAATLRVHSLSKPRMEMDTEKLEGGTVALREGEAVAMQCTAAAEPPARLRLRLLNGTGGAGDAGTGTGDAGFALTPWRLLQIPFVLRARGEDDGARIVCDAQVEAGNGTLRRSSDPIALNIQYAPRLEESGCPAEQRWTQGREAALLCAARGNPPPRVECSREGRPFPVDEPRAAERGHAGTYRCRAENGMGKAERDVEVHVEASAFPVLPVTLLLVAAVAAAAGAGAAYGIYYRKTRIRRYRLREQQRRMQLQPPAAPNGSAAAPNGAAAGSGNAEPLPP